MKTHRHAFDYDNNPIEHKTLCGKTVTNTFKVWGRDVLPDGVTCKSCNKINLIVCAKLHQRGR